MIEKILGASTDVAAALEAGEQFGRKVEVVDINGRPFAFLPEGVTQNDMTHTLPRPIVAKQTTHLGTAQSFIHYVGLFSDPKTTLVFYNRDEGIFEAVIDFHASNLSWKSHRAFLKLKPTEPWKEWMGGNKLSVNQSTFATFIEQHVPEIAEPSGATLLEMIRNFEAKKDVAYRSVQRASDGSIQFSYQEEVRGAEVAGNIRVPSEFTLVLKPFEDAEDHAVKALLRWRLTGAALTLWYELVRPDEVRSRCFDQIVDQINHGLEAVVRACLEGADGSR